MSVIFSYILDFFKQVDKWLLLLCTGFTALLVFINVKWDIETKWLFTIPNRVQQFGGFYMVYFIAFIIPFLFVLLFQQKTPPLPLFFWILLLITPALFSLKVNFNLFSKWIEPTPSNHWARYYSIVVSLPSKLLMLCIPLWIIWKAGNYGPSFWGFTTRNFQWQPYLVMLLLMIPLIAFAATQADFLQAYPKLKKVNFIEEYSNHHWLYQLLYEISYGIDFIAIELFFRGFLVFAFVRYVGPDAILPMAVFYCSIHFGKPLLECISSFFGGMLLGILAYRTNTIAGGILVHLGIAWMMEVAGVLGNRK
jgi:hypothetical protein